MKEVLPKFIGSHDFSQFAINLSEIKNTRRRIDKFSLHSSMGFIECQIEGNSNLPGMIRMLMGTLIKVGRGKITPEMIDYLLSSTIKKKIQLLPACGLYLMEVGY